MKTLMTEKVDERYYTNAQSGGVLIERGPQRPQTAKHIEEKVWVEISREQFSEWQDTGTIKGVLS